MTFQRTQPLYFTVRSKPQPSLHYPPPPRKNSDSCKQNLRAACPKKDRLEFKFFRSLQWTKLREVGTKSSSLPCKNLLVVYCLVSCSLNKCTLFLWLIWMLKFHFKMYFNSCTFMYSKLDILCNFCFPQNSFLVFLIMEMRYENFPLLQSFEMSRGTAKSYFVAPKVQLQYSCIIIVSLSWPEPIYMPVGDIF